MTNSNWFLLIVDNWLWPLQTGSSLLLKLAVTSSNWFLCWLLKLDVTSSKWFMLVAETGSNKPKPVLTGSTWQVKRRWLWLVQTGLCWLLKLDVTSSNWFLLDCWNWLWLVQTLQYWLLKLSQTSLNQFLMVLHDKTTGDGCELVQTGSMLIVETGCD